MKNTIVVLILLLLCIPLFAQNDPVKTTSLPDENNVVYPRLDSFLLSGKNYHSLLYSINKNQWDAKRYIELYKQQHPAEKQATPRAVTFMDGPVIYPMTLPLEISRNPNTLYQRYSDGYTPPSTTTTALQILGLVGGIAAGAFDPRYNNWNRNTSAVDAYLQSTYYQHNK